MKYPWAVVGAKVVYIGPEVVMQILWTSRRTKIMPSPLVHNVVYTIEEVFDIQREIGITVAEYPTGIFHAALFKPLNEKDAEMFDEWLKKLPQDLIVEDLSERIAENVE